MPGVFVSYALDDRAVADRLVRDLRAAGVQAWYDADLHAGDTWQPLLEGQLEEADALIVLLGPGALRPGPMAQDWAAAIRRSSRVIPVLINGAGPADVPAELRGSPQLDLAADYDAAVRRLTTEIRGLHDSPAPSVATSIDVAALVEDVASRVLLQLSPQPPADGDLVFVVSSFDPSMEPVFEGIAAAAATVGLRAEWLKDAQGDYRITDQILARIRAARMVVVDLTFERPNVYFELGYARGLDKTVVTIAKKDTHVHVDVRDWTYLSYTDSRPLERDLVKRFRYELGERSAG